MRRSGGTRLAPVVKRWCALVVVVVAGTGIGVGANRASAYVYTVNPLFRASDFATGFTSAPTSVAIGPDGLAYVGDAAGDIYAFSAEGGLVSSARRVATGLGRLSDLVFSANGVLYASRFETPAGPATGDVVQVDPSTGAARTVVSGLHGAEGLRQDPVSGDLFVSQARADGSRSVWRITGLDGVPSMISYATGTAGPYEGGFLWPEGLSFGQHGSLFLADFGNNDVFAIGGSRSVQPAAVSILASVPPGSSPMGVAALPNLLLVDREDGTVIGVDLTSAARTQTSVLAGGLGGGMMSIGPEGCAYAAERERIIKLTNADGTCPVTGAASPDLPASASPASPESSPALTKHLSPTKTPLAVESLAISPSSVVAASAGPSAIIDRRARRRSGARVSYTLTKPATVRFTLERRLTGRLDGSGVCRPGGRALHVGHRCGYYVALHGAMTLNGQAGANSFTFTGRLARKRLPRARYLMVATPYVGPVSGAAATAAFMIVG